MFPLTLPPACHKFHQTAQGLVTFTFMGGCKRLLSSYRNTIKVALTEEAKATPDLAIYIAINANSKVPLITLEQRDISASVNQHPGMNSEFRILGCGKNEAKLLISKMSSIKHLRSPRCTCCHTGCMFIYNALSQESVHLIRTGIFLHLPAAEKQKASYVGFA